MNRAFTIIELILYFGIASIFVIIIFPLINQILKYTSFYQSKVSLRNDFSRVFQQLNFEAQTAQQIDLLPDWGIIFWKGGSSTEIRATKPNLINGPNLEGYAWGYQIGAISLKGESYGVSRQPAATCNFATTTIPSAFSYERTYAWSPMIGWIKFRDSGPDYGVCEEVNGDLRGFAWSDVIGWISFNCRDLGVCNSSNYKVYQQNQRLYGYAWNDVAGWIKFDGSEQKVLLHQDNKEEALTTAAVSVENLIFQEDRQTTRFSLLLQNLDKTKIIYGSTTIFKWGR